MVFDVRLECFGWHRGQSCMCEGALRRGCGVLAGQDLGHKGLQADVITHNAVTDARSAKSAEWWLGKMMETG